jgi:hypothetical protein
VSGFPHTQIPLVFALVVGPTANPEDELRIILLRRNDFPVLYIPATEITATFPCNEAKNYKAYGLT